MATNCFSCKDRGYLSLSFKITVVARLDPIVQPASILYILNPPSLTLAASHTIEQQQSFQITKS